MVTGSAHGRAGQIRPARPSGLDAYILTVVVAGGVAGAVALAGQDWLSPLQGHLVSFVLLAAFVVTGELRPIAISRGDDVDYITLSIAFVLPVLAVGGLALAMVVLMIASLVDDCLGRRGLRKTAFNLGQYMLSLLAARTAYAVLSGQPVFGPGAEFDRGHVLPLLLAGAVFVLVNHGLVAVAMSLWTRQPFLRMALSDLRFSLSTQGVLVAIAPLAAITLSLGPEFVALIAVPVLALQLSAAQAMRREQEALHDSLTGLGNRELLRQRLQRSLDSADKDGTTGPGLVLLDLDHFKDVNDTLGHPVGDELLCQVANRLTAVVGDRGQVARLGGDEFAVVVPGPLVRAEEVARALMASFDEVVLVGDLRLLVRASAGIAAAPAHGRTSSELMKNADVALYDAKGERGRSSTYVPELDVNSVERLQLIDDLRVALDEDRLDVAYQPQVRIDDGRLVGVEALVRWDHPERGDVPPDVFVPLAENAGMISRVTAFVLDVALGQLATWTADGHDLRLAVNVAARQLSDLAMPQLVDDTLRRHGVPASRLVLEVTETGILSDPVRVDVVVRELRRLGVGIAVDDYGTGHASLSYLKRLEVDELKVDRSFVTEMVQRPSDFIIVRSTVTMARDLGLRVVAEGVEDAVTSRALLALGCDVAQGWFHGRPVDGVAILDRLRASAAAGPAPQPQAVQT